MKDNIPRAKNFKYIHSLETNKSTFEISNSLSIDKCWLSGCTKFKLGASLNNCTKYYDYKKDCSKHKSIKWHEARSTASEKNKKHRPKNPKNQYSKGD